MKTILDLIVEELKPAFTGCGYDEKYIRVTVSNRPDLCEYQCNGAMAAAKAYKKKPIDIANEVVEKTAGSKMFSEINAVMPGFINIRLNPCYLASYVQQVAEDEKLGLNAAKKPETIIIDYGGANVAKPLHVGHLRSAVIGESIKRISRYMGHHVISDVHLGDWGLQMGLIIEELHDRQPDLVYFDPDYTGEYPSEPPFTISELEDIYPAASAKSKVDAAFRERAQQATFKLQSGYAPFHAIWKHIMNVSLKDLKKNYGNLNVSFDLWKGESDAQPYIPGLIEDLQKKGLAYESDGALVVDIAQEGDAKEYPPCIVRKSDGAALYATSDLATIIEREQDFHPDHYIYVVDKRQELYFEQVFRCARKTKLVEPETELKFLGFGTMNGKDGKPFKTRSGGVMRLEQLIGDITEFVRKKVVENQIVEADQVEETTRRIAMAALKYGDLSNQPTKDYIFDMDRFAAFEGNTGPYILYTVVRIKSILARYGSWQHLEIQAPASAAQKDLMLAVTKLAPALEGAYRDSAPNLICSYIYELAGAVNAFYHETRILTEADPNLQAGYIALIGLAKDILEQCIYLLGFQAPEKM